MSPHYNAAVNASYFEQCFDNLGELGKGSFGVVYKARSRDTGEIFAVKKSTKRYKGTRDRLRRLMEVQTGGAINDSPYCLRYYGGWEEKCVVAGGGVFFACFPPGRFPWAHPPPFAIRHPASDVLYLQTEYCKNGSLRDYAYSVEMVPEDRAWEFLTDAALVRGVCCCAAGPRR